MEIPSLESLGLTTYESNAFVSLLELGVSDARSISNHSGVPFGRIYDILSLLESKDLIDVQPSRPKQYRPIDPKIAIDKLLTIKEREFKHLEDQAKKIQYRLQQMYNPNDQDQSIFWKVGIGDDLIPSYIEMMKQTDSEIQGYVELHQSVTLDDIDFFFNVLQELISSDVRISILVGTEHPDDIRDVLTEYNDIIHQIEVRYRNPIREPFNIIDREKVILKVRNPIDPSEDFAFIYIWDKEFATELRTIYRELWLEANEF